MRHCDVEIINPLDFFSPFINRLRIKSNLIPGALGTGIRIYYLKYVQLKYIELISSKKPDLIFIYNDQMLCAETLDKIDKRIKIAVYLADSPLFLKRRAHIISLIRRADVVFAPDSYWLEQCRLLGAKNAEYLIPGFNNQHHFMMKPSSEQFQEYVSDVFFMGSPYNDNWGYKRALFLSKFCDFNFLFIGPECWKGWFTQFPELKSKFKIKKGYLKDEELNLFMNCTKIVPVDANPGIINGCHIRVFDTIATGKLPLIEYRKDLDDIFKDTGLIFIKNYNEIPELTRYYLEHDTERNSLTEMLHDKILNKYNIINASEIIFTTLNI